MGRTILAIVLGALAMVICVGGIEALGHTLFPPPPDVDLSDPTALAALMSQIPLTAKLFVVLAWAVGAFVGGLVAARVSRQHKQGAALTIGILMIALSAISLVMIPHPVWMIICALLLPIPLALAGRKLAGG